MAVIGGFRSVLSITRKTDGNFGNVSACVLFSNGGIMSQACSGKVCSSEYVLLVKITQEKKSPKKGEPPRA